MGKTDKNDIGKSSEEVQDIIDRMPGKTGILVAVILIVMAGFLLFFGWLIEYPEKVTGPVSITARQAPVRLVANTSGKLRLLNGNSDTVKQDRIFAYIENPALLEDVLKVSKYIEEHDPDTLFYDPSFTNDLAVMSLGELNNSFYGFLNHLEKIRQYNEGKPYERKTESLASLLKSQLKLEEYYQKQLSTKGRTLQIAGKNVRRDSLLYRSSAIAEQDIDRSSINYLGVLESSQKMEEDYTTLKMQIDDTRHKLQMLALEKSEVEQKLRIDLLTSYNELSAGIRMWKLKYTFSSPIDGILEYLNFWRENDYVAAGTDLFSVLPGDNPIFGQVYLPAQGAGKVSSGQDVIIKLDNYPYIEYGSIRGKVRTISNMANPVKEFGGQGAINTYMIIIDLPDQLTTNYGVKLDFSYEIRGIADILTRKRKLIVRLFDNLRYIASNK